MWENRATMHLLRRAHQLHASRWRFHVPELTPVQFGLLQAIAELDGAEQGTIGEAAAVDRATMTEVIRRMVSAGWIRRERAEHDGRVQFLFLTDAGREVHAGARPGAMAARNEVLEPLEDDEVEQLRSLLSRIVGRASS